jgi:hypothetical protein
MLVEATQWEFRMQLVEDKAQVGYGGCGSTVASADRVKLLRVHLRYK